MKYKLATTCFVIGAMLAPVAAYAEDTDAAITTKIKTQLAAEHFGSLKDISVDIDKNGVVWMTGKRFGRMTVNRPVQAVTQGALPEELPLFEALCTNTGGASCSLVRGAAE